jgi:hypothetical protein
MRFLLVLALLGGCAAPPEVAARSAPVWREPGSYQFTVTSSCGERAMIGTFRTRVQNGAVTEREGLDDSARRALMLGLASEVPTLGRLKAEAEKSHADIVLDPSDGHPISINIDDEHCYAISDYSVG